MDGADTFCGYFSHTFYIHGYLDKESQKHICDRCGHFVPIANPNFAAYNKRFRASTPLCSVLL